MKRQYTLWKEDEKDLFWQNVQQFDAQGQKIQFDKIARSLRTKTARQCYDYYNLNKDKQDSYIKRHQWTAEEEQFLYGFVRQNGPDWHELMKAMPNLSFQQLKNRYYLMCKRMQNGHQEKSQEKIIHKVSKIIGQQ